MSEEKEVISSSSFIGYTSGYASPVFFDFQAPNRNASKNVVVINGSPGGGKTFLSLMSVAMSTQQGGTTVVMDKKGDFIALKNIEHDIGPVNIWEFGEGMEDGFLSPFYRVPKNEQKALILSVVEILVDMTPEYSRKLNPILDDILNQSRSIKSLDLLVRKLKSDQNEDARNLGIELDAVSDMKNSRALFGAPSDQKELSMPIHPSEVTVIITRDLDLPDHNGKEMKLTKSERLSNALFYLISDYVNRALHKMPVTVPKTFMIDEAWHILQIPQGDALLNGFARMGRSKNFSLVLATQDYELIKGKSIELSVGAHFSFFMSGNKFIDTIIDAMGLPTEQGWDGIISSLDVGECIFRDWHNPPRYSKMKVFCPNAMWTEAFNTNAFNMADKKEDAGA